MAWTSTDLSALETAIKAGTRRVRYGDREVEYHSIAEMLTLRDQMRAEIADPDGTLGSVVFAARVPG